MPACAPEGYLLTRRKLGDYPRGTWGLYPRHERSGGRRETQGLSPLSRHRVCHHASSIICLPVPRRGICLPKEAWGLSQRNMGTVPRVRSEAEAGGKHRDCPLCHGIGSVIMLPPSKWKQKERPSASTHGKWKQKERPLASY